MTGVSIPYIYIKREREFTVEPWVTSVSVSPTRSFVFTCHVKIAQWECGTETDVTSCPPCLASLFSRSVSWISHSMYIFSKNLLVYYCKCCNLIGYATRYLFVNRYRVAVSNATRSSFSKKNKQCLFLVFRNNFEEITQVCFYYNN